ncbi:MAG: exodeoxyribonuclease V subunit beta [Buchnera aphidicola (Periphyllus acericola)]|nr:exodeoxyribonuclease V subunit beta [Buchnera aphidicola (Periphyllus acericola)]
MLIITYTNNAKIEIQNRLSKNIYNFYIDLKLKKTRNKNYKKIFKKIKNFKKSRKILKIAYLKINHAPIYTIHGFCKNILKSYNLTYKNTIKKKIYQDQEIYKKSTYDFWRKFIVPLEKNILNIILKYWKHPKYLLLEINSWLNIKSKVFIYKQKKYNISKKHKKNIKKIYNFKIKWNKIKSILKKFFLKKKLNKRIYNKKNIFNWIKKITIWSKKKTINYNFPKEINKFYEKKIYDKLSKIEKIKYKFLKIIKNFLKNNFSLKNIILLQAIKKIKHISNIKKKKKFCFDNLIKFLLLKLKNNKKLCHSIEKKFPIAFIDEFQDTDYQQYEIFKKIYQNYKKSSLILIGDPKQSIYAFRGADIFFYFKIKSKISNIYKLNTNWRSSYKIIKNINFLFSQIKNSFIFKEIKYTPLNYTNESKKIKLIIKKKEQPSITFWFKKQKNKKFLEYDSWIAKKCAKNIFYLIKQIKQNNAFLKTSNSTKKLEIKDICILIKNYKEYKKINHELKKFKINSHYTSNKKSIFQTLEVQEMFYILKSILNISNELYLKKALSTSIIFKNSYEIYQLKKKYNILSNIYKKFYNYLKIWKKNGILNLIKKIIYESHLYKEYFFKNKNKKKISNLIHLSEILEKKSILKKKFDALLIWFKEKIKNKKNIKKKYYERSDYKKKNTIQIVTIYKSKGLEYPIVWIPFISNFKISKKLIYHNRKTFNTYININNNKKKNKLEEEERLSEDIRLLYVAITRSKFHCSIGINPLIQKKSITKNTNFHKSGLGYILQKGKKMNICQLSNKLKKICLNKGMSIKSKEKKYLLKNKKKENKKQCIKNIFNRNFKKILYTSYTKINKNNLKKNIAIIKNKKKTKYNQYFFPQGKKYGILLHKILKKINFKKKIKKKFLFKIFKKKICKKWLNILKKWIKNIILTPLNDYGINLFKLNQENYLKELEFSLLLKKKIDFNSINNLINNKKNIYEKKVKGVLKGFIDIVFQDKKKYYLIDFKSNYLGKNKKKYKNKEIVRTIKKNRYDIQYYIYSVALHKFLKKKLKNYSFKKNFGGIYYLFLRGMNGKDNKTGIFFYKPKKKIIKKLDKNFFTQSKI